MIDVTSLWRRLRALGRGSFDDELDDEMRLHMELRRERLEAQGTAPEEARAAARRQFGNTLRLREESRDSWGWRWLEHLAQDLRFGIRMALRNPGYAVAAILTLALGIGANTAVFSVLYGVALRPLPYTNGERLLLIRQSAPGLHVADAQVSVKEFYDYRARATSFDALVEYHQMFFDLLRRGEPDRVNVGVVSHDFFAVLGITPLHGRTFTANDDRPAAAAVLLLSHAYWQNKFAGDPAIVGQVLEMNDRPHTVVGVLPDVPHYPQENDVYMPVASCPFRANAENLPGRRAFSILNVFGRLREGVSEEAARREVEEIGGRFPAAHTGQYPGEAHFAATTLSVRNALVREAQPLLLLLLGATGLILLIACANVANLALSRLLRRDRELGLREAVGAGRGRLVRQLLTESTLLSVSGGLIGLGAAASSLSLLTAFAGRFTSRTGEIAIDGWVLAFALALSTLTGIAFGTIPALTIHTDLGAIIRGGRVDGDPARRRLQSALVVAQVAISAVLLIGAGLLLTSVYRLGQVDPGYRPEQTITADIFGNFSNYTRERLQQLYTTLVTRLEAESDIAVAAVTNGVPLTTFDPGAAAMRIESEPETERLPAIVDVRVVTPHYFQTLEVPLLEGRGLADADTGETSANVVVNQTLARRWTDRPAIGARVSFDGGSTWRTVVGIVADVRQFGFTDKGVPQAYLPLLQAPSIEGRVVFRTTLDRAAAEQLLKRHVRALEPDMPVENITTLADLRRDYLSRPLLTAALVLICAALALIVTMTGIAGVMAMHVSRRIKEFGVRLALGATREQVLRPVLSEGFGLIAAGLVIGLTAAAALAQLLSSYLFDTTPTDPLTFTVAAAALLVAGGLACLGPAWRATRVDPQVVFRSE
jgi:predicted permease